MPERKELPIHLVIEALERNVVDVPLGQPAFEDPRYKPFELNTEYFTPLPKNSQKQTISFVDGGSAEIIGAPNFSVGLCRVYFNLFLEERRLEAKRIPQRIDFFTICFAKPSSGQIIYETEFVPLKEEWGRYLPNVSDLSFNSLDKSLMMGSQRVPVSRVIDVSRSFAEWSLARFVVSEELERGDLLVRDGSLQTIATNEGKYAQGAYEAALRKKVYFSSLSKTSTLLTKTGQPLLYTISELSESSPLKEEAWYYYPIAEINQPDHRAEMLAIKLHKLSDYVFRFEVLKDQVDKNNFAEVGSLISSLAKNSRELMFPGYPYGLMDADKFARVTGSEKRSNEFQLKAISGKVWQKVSKYVKSTDAHEILNKL